RKRDDPDKDMDAEIDWALKQAGSLGLACSEIGDDHLLSSLDQILRPGGYWRLWDIDTGEELLLQEAHNRSVYGISFHQDGSLVTSCGLDSLARVWDLRIGISILALEGHFKPMSLQNYFLCPHPFFFTLSLSFQVLGISFSANGYYLIWDLRKKKSCTPTHANLISHVKFEPQEGYFLVTASYAMTTKPVKTRSRHEAKVTSFDITGDGNHNNCFSRVCHFMKHYIYKAPN
ncbi:hypothetical protein UlMin_017997, partial [Ulmus minor]